MAPDVGGRVALVKGADDRGIVGLNRHVGNDRIDTRDNVQEVELTCRAVLKQGKLDIYIVRACRL
jgi:hypothetical protein